MLVSTRDSGVSARTPLFSWLRRAAVLAAMLIAAAGARADDAIVVVDLTTTDFDAAHEALIDAIEEQGLKVSNVVPFGDMLARTAPALGRPASPFARAEIVQFCSAAVAWALVAEDPRQMALCPMGIDLVALDGTPARLRFAYRSPGRASAGRAQMDALLRETVERAQRLLPAH